MDVPPPATTVVGGDTKNNPSVSVNPLSDIARRGAAEDSDTSHTLVNPWRQLDRNAFVIAYATKGTARCGACLSKVAKGELQVSSDPCSYSRCDFTCSGLSPLDPSVLFRPGIKHFTTV